MKEGPSYGYLSIAEFWRYVTLAIIGLSVHLAMVIFAAGMLYFQVQSLEIGVQAGRTEVEKLRKQLESNPPLPLKRQEQFEDMKTDIVELKLLVRDTFRSGLVRLRENRREEVEAWFKEWDAKKERDEAAQKKGTIAPKELPE